MLWFRIATTYFIYSLIQVKLYWKKQLSGKIIGSIQQVDLYKNNRWQLAFRTADRMMILDRNGKIVKPFNIKLPKSINPLHYLFLIMTIIAITVF